MDMTYNLQSSINQYLQETAGSNLTEYIKGEFGNLAGVVSHNGKIYVIFFIRQWFRMFGKIMGIGQCEGVTIPTHALEKAVGYNADIIFVTPKDKYQISANLFRSFVKNNGTIWNKPKTGIHESGVSFDILTRMQ